MATRALTNVLLVVLLCFSAAVAAQDGVYADRIVVGQSAAFTGGLGPMREGTECQAPRPTSTW